MNAFVIAGTHSGVGKTTVSVGLMAAFKNQGLQVQAFKVGPDYIDPSYHAAVTGGPSYNLDSWLCSEARVKESFARVASWQMNVVEGVMGLFDGAAGGQGSTASLAKTLALPVILVVDARGMAQSVGAVVHGFATYDSELRLAGVIFNRVASAGHYAYLKESVKIPVLGWIEREEAMALPERHLGLVPALERAPDIAVIAATVSRHIDLDKLREMTEQPHRPSQALSLSHKTVRIAYAKDLAFHFYYAENLDLLQAAGAELIPFSPLGDEMLPEADLLYLGGGFPELFESQLLANVCMVEALLDWDKPIYAECGGLYYLSLIGKIPGRVRMHKRLQNFGYAEATALCDTPLVKRGERIKGHEFHYSSWEGPASLYEIEKRGKIRKEGYADGKIFASYLHVHFASNPQIACRLIAIAKG